MDPPLAGPCPTSPADDDGPPFTEVVDGAPMAHRCLGNAHDCPGAAAAHRSVGLDLIGTSPAPGTAHARERPSPVMVQPGHRGAAFPPCTVPLSSGQLGLRPWEQPHHCNSELARGLRAPEVPNRSLDEALVLAGMAALGLLGRGVREAVAYDLPPLLVSGAVLEMLVCLDLDDL